MTVRRAKRIAERNIKSKKNSRYNSVMENIKREIKNSEDAYVTVIVEWLEEDQQNKIKKYWMKRGFVVNEIMSSGPFFQKSFVISWGDQ